MRLPTTTDRANRLTNNRLQDQENIHTPPERCVSLPHTARKSSSPQPRRQGGKDARVFRRAGAHPFWSGPHLQRMPNLPPTRHLHLGLVGVEYSHNPMKSLRTREFTKGAHVA